MNDTGTYCRSTLKKPREKTEKTKDRKKNISSASIVLNFTHRNSFPLSVEQLYAIFILFIYLLFFTTDLKSASEQTSEQVHVLRDGSREGHVPLK